MAGGVPGGYNLPGTAPPPRKSSSGTGCLIWSLVGCGVLAVLMVALGAAGIYSLGRNKEVRNALGGITAMGSCSENLRQVRDALQQYTKEHKGKYPARLSDLPEAVPQMCMTGDTENKMQYTPPAPNAPDDTIVVSVESGGINIATQKQLYFTRLLKDGRIVFDQVVRTTVYPAPVGRSQRERASTP